ncbi:uncharacterized protein N7469_005281 [Penicillium citrinum]|uniref:Uncharacterized protein n=1 Tax=Penicillium citrinum TaxID=5077 RepID=A0A9W9TNY5_PENCI|nr:uncharacterized protein N7469_005281 [Penicillium citrinum]KAJ5233515.1 hypothetical protein N7469_005281 [Penicillium citrinum]
MADLLKITPLAIHYIYIILVSMLGSIVLYTASALTKGSHIQYVDALFTSFSATTGTGLNVVDLSTLSCFQQGTIFALLLLGHAFPIFGVIYFSRALSFRSALKDNIADAEKVQVPWPSFVQQDGAHCEMVKGCDKQFEKDVVSVRCTDEVKARAPAITVQEVIIDSQIPDRSSFTEYNAGHGHADIDNREKFVKRFICWSNGTIQRATKRFSSTRFTDYNDPDGIKCMAYGLVAILILFYFIGLLILGSVVIGLWSVFVRPDIPLDNGSSPLWAGVFLATSAICNNGMSLIDTNMGPYQKEVFPLLVCGLLILAGSRLFPCLLRSFIWVIRMILPNRATWDLIHQTLDFVLEQSHDFCVYLYPTWQTYLLSFNVLMCNAILWGGFEISATYSEEISALPPKFQVLDGLFQALSVRSGGFSVVAFDRLPQGLLILYIFFDFSRFCHRQPFSKDTRQQSSFIPNLSIFPLARSVGQKIWSQFNSDIQWLGFATLLISIIESDHFRNDPLAFSTFKIIFETVSAYSCVGVSIGYPGQSYAFCGSWHALSKLVLIAVSLQGRHRGLASSLDTSIALSDHLDDQWSQHVPKEKGWQLEGKGGCGV